MLATQRGIEVLLAPLRVKHVPPSVVMTARLLERDGVPAKGDAVTIDIATLSDLVVTRRKFISEKRG